MSLVEFARTFDCPVPVVREKIRNGSRTFGADGGTGFSGSRSELRIASCVTRPASFAEAWRGSMTAWGTIDERQSGGSTCRAGRYIGGVAAKRRVVRNRRRRIAFVFPRCTWEGWRERWRDWL